jgi:hypothetical protein
MEKNVSVSQATIQLLECEQSLVSAHYLSVGDEDHLPRGLTDAALLGQTLRQLLAS